MKRYIIMACACSGFGVIPGVYAQQNQNDSTLNRTVVVENQFNPEVMDASKINVLPKMEEPAVEKKLIDYATTTHLVTGWEDVAMQPMVREWQQSKTPRGYFRAGYGTKGNLDVKGSYLWDISEKDRLKVMASSYGLNGSMPSYFGEKDWDARFYRTDASLDYKHKFNTVSLGIGGSFASQVFNYMCDENYTGHDRQHYTLGEGYVGIASLNEELPLQFSVQTGFRMFDRKYDFPVLEKGGENIIHTLGNVWGNLNNDQKVGIGFSMDNLMYDAATFKDYTLLKLNPYYTLQSDDYKIRLGANVDWQTANGSGINVSPDIRLEYIFSDSYVLYLNAEGGTRLNDFRTLNNVFPYWNQNEQLRSTYTPVDAKLGLKASPVNNLSFEIFGGYRITKNELFSMPFEERGYYYTNLLQEKAKVGYGGLSIAYGYKDWFDFGLKGIYYSWNCEEGNDALLFLKPQFTLDFQVRAKIFEGLYINAGYQYEGRKELKQEGLGKAEPISNLYVGVEYLLFNRLTVFARCNNLLNKEYITESGYPSQLFHAVAGVSIRF